MRVSERVANTNRHAHISLNAKAYILMRNNFVFFFHSFIFFTTNLKMCECAFDLDFNSMNCKK